MKPFSILLIRVLGLYLFLKALFSVLPAFLGPYASELWSAEWLPMLVATAAVPMLGGVLLWCFAGRLAGRLYGDAEAGIGVGDEELVRAGSFLIGVYLLVRHAGTLVGGYASTGAIAYESLIVVVASLGMILGTGFLGALYLKVKYFGADS